MDAPGRNYGQPVAQTTRKIFHGRSREGLCPSLLQINHATLFKNPLPLVPGFGSSRLVPSFHSAPFTGPAPGRTGPSGFPRAATVFRGRPHGASCPGRPRMDFLSIRPLDSRSAWRWAKGSRSRKRRRVLPERLVGGTGMSRQARRGRMPLRAVATAQAMEGERLCRRQKSAPGMPSRVRQSARVAPRKAWGRSARDRMPLARHRACCAKNKGTGRVAGRVGKRGSRPISRVLSRTIIHLGLPSPAASSDLPESAAGRGMAFLFGLAPGGVYLAAACYHLRGALLPHHFTLTGSLDE